MCVVVHVQHACGVACVLCSKFRQVSVCASFVEPPRQVAAKHRNCEVPLAVAVLITPAVAVFLITAWPMRCVGDG